MKNSTSYRVPPLWPFAIITLLCAAMLVYLVLTKHNDSVFSLIETIILVLGSTYVFIVCWRGFVLDADCFIITWFGITLERVPWDNISQVVLVHKKVLPNADRTILHSRVLYVTIKPAGQFPTYAKAMFSYRLCNPFLIWRIYLYSDLPSTEEELLDAFGRFFGDITIVDHR